MSDYPRPSEVPLSINPYLADRVVAWAYAALLVGSEALWIVQTSRLPNLERVIETWWAYYVASVAMTLFMLWALFALTRRRLWAFVTTLFVTGIEALERVHYGRLLQASVVFLLFLYAATRASGFLGPRPLRRRDL